MSYDTLLSLESVDEYKAQYERAYCNKIIRSHDGIVVKFPLSRFAHAFFKSKNREKHDKSLFDWERAERMMWIEKVLTDPNVEMHIGWDTAKKRYDSSYRVALITSDDYVVIIRFTGPESAAFVTAYLVDRAEVSHKIRTSPLWITNKTI